MHRLGIGIVAAGAAHVLSAFCSASFAEGQGQALLEALRKGDLELVRELLGQGSDVNARDDLGRTVLMYAAEGGNLDVVKFLIDEGGDVNARGKYDQTVLMYVPGKGTWMLSNS